MIRKTILSLPVNACSYKDFIDQLFALSSNRQSSYVCFANVHMIVESHNDPTFRASISNADLVAADGKPVSFLFRWFHKVRQDRISGPDVFVDLLKKCEAYNKSVFFYGSTTDVLEKLRLRIQRENPRLQVKGFHSPPFRDLTPAENDADAKRINRANADFVFVALGCPRQEKWMALQKNAIHSCMLGVGQAFGIYAGTLKRAPRWLQNLGLEWGFRLLTEPRRLWKRYLVTNSLFIYLIVKTSLRSLFSLSEARTSGA